MNLITGHHSNYLSPNRIIRRAHIELKFWMSLSIFLFTPFYFICKKGQRLKYFIGITALIFLMLSSYTTAYYIIEIRPTLSAIDEKVTRYSYSSRNSELLASIAMQQEGRSGMFRYVAHRQAINNIEHGFRNAWHLMGLHWHLWLKILYSDQEIYQLWLAQFPYSEGRGINEAAEYYFNISFWELSCYQIVQLAAMARAPTALKPGSERSEKWIRSQGIGVICSQ